MTPCEQALVHAGGVATLKVTKLPCAGMCARPCRLEAGDDLFHAGTVQRVAAGDELVVIRAPPRRPREGEVVAVERLAHAVHQVGDLGGGQRIADAQTGEAVESSRRCA